MNKTILIVIGIAAAFALGYFTNGMINKPAETKEEAAKKESKKEEVKEDKPEVPPQGGLRVGAFSMSLNVKDLQASKEFYETLGFTTTMDVSQGYLIMKNGNAIIGIFKGMFEGNMMTFNPGWDENAKNLVEFDDVREIQKALKAKNIKLITEADESTTGPAFIMLKDPDGNTLLFDQHR